MRDAVNHCNFGFDDVFVPVSRTWGSVTCQREARLGLHGDVVRPSHATLEHSASPKVNLVFQAIRCDALRLEMPTHPPKFEVDDAARTELFGFANVANAVNWFV